MKLHIKVQLSADFFLELEYYLYKNILFVRSPMEEIVVYKGDL